MRGHAARGGSTPAAGPVFDTCRRWAAACTAIITVSAVEVPHRIMRRRALDKIPTAFVRARTSGGPDFDCHTCAAQGH